MHSMLPHIYILRLKQASPGCMSLVDIESAVGFFYLNTDIEFFHVCHKPISQWELDQPISSALCIVEIWELLHFPTMAFSV